MRYWETFLRLSIAGLILLLLTGIVDRGKEAVHAFRTLRNAGFDYQKMMEGPNSHRRPRYQKGEGDLIRIFSEAREIIPENSKISWSLPVEGAYAEVIVRYALAPPHFVGTPKSDWEFFIDAGEELKEDSAYSNRNLLPSGVWVYAKSDQEFLPRRSGRPIKMGHKLSVFGGLTAFYLLVGGCLLLAFGFRFQGERLWFIGAAYLLGFLVANYAIQVFLMVGGRLTVSSMLWVRIPLGIVLLVWGVRTFRRQPARANPIVDEGSRPAAWLSFLVAAGIVSLVSATAALTGVDSWDDRGHWILKSKSFFHYHSLRFDLPFHNEYPILWPLGVANTMVWMGGALDEAAKWTAALWLPALATQLFGGLRLLQVRASYAFLLVFIFFACIYDVHLTTGQPHSALMCYVAGALVAAIGWYRDPTDRRYLWLLLFFSWGLCNTKLEGSLMAIMIAMALIFSAGRNLFSKSTWIAAIVCCLPILSVWAWIEWQQAQGYLTGVTGHPTTGIGPTKLYNVFRTLAGTLEGRAEGYRLLAGMVLILLLIGRRRWAKVTIFLALCSLAFFFFTPLAVSGFPSDDAIRKSITATPRLMLHATPAFLLFLGSLVKGIERDEPRDSS